MLKSELTITKRIICVPAEVMGLIRWGNAGPKCGKDSLFDETGKRWNARVRKL